MGWDTLFREIAVAIPEPRHNVKTADPALAFPRRGNMKNSFARHLCHGSDTAFCEWKRAVARLTAGTMA